MGPYELLERRGLGEAVARTATVNSVVAIETVSVFDTRSLVQPVRLLRWFTNPRVFVVVAVMFVLRLAFAGSGRFASDHLKHPINRTIAMR